MEDALGQIGETSRLLGLLEWWGYSLTNMSILLTPFLYRSRAKLPAFFPLYNLCEFALSHTDSYPGEIYGTLIS